MIIYVGLAQIHDNPFQSRQEYGEIEELAADIARHYDTRPETLGLQQVPAGRLRVSIKSVAQLTQYGILEENSDMFVELEFGHRRLRAFRSLAETDERYVRMPVNILPLTDDEMLNGVWSENSARKDLSAVEEAALLARKLESCGSQAAVADAWGMARSTVANKLRLLTLPAAVQEANRTGRLSERQALNLVPVLRLQEQIRQLEKPPVFGKEITSRHWETPAGPDQVIEHVLANPETSSDVIRDLTKWIESHAGAHLPEEVAKFSPDSGSAVEPIRGFPCKGCNMRGSGNVCFDQACLDAKTGLVVNVLVGELAEEMGLPVSDNEDHFFLGGTSPEEVRIMKRAWDNGWRDNMVVGWWKQYALRPDGKVGVFRGNNAGLLRDGLAIGYTPGAVDKALREFVGALPAGEDGGGKDRPPHHDQLPSGEQVAAWLVEAKKILRDIYQRGKQEIAEQIELLMDYEAAAFIYQVATGMESRPVPATNKAVAGLLVQNWSGGALSVERLPAWFHYLAGLDLDAGRVQGPDYQREQAVLALGTWHGEFKSVHYLYDSHKRAAETIFALSSDRGFGARHPGLALWVDTARIDIIWFLETHFNGSDEDRQKWPDIPELEHLLPRITPPAVVETGEEGE